MKNLFKIVCCVFVLAIPLWAPISTRLNITEQDGSPSTFPYQAKFSNGTVTDNGDGTVSISNSGGGGSPGGTGTQIQYNNSGSFGGVPGSSVTATGPQISSGTISRLNAGNLVFAKANPFFDGSCGGFVGGAGIYGNTASGCSGSLTLTGGSNTMILDPQFSIQTGPIPIIFGDSTQQTTAFLGYGNANTWTATNTFSKGMTTSTLTVTGSSVLSTTTVLSSATFRAPVLVRSSMTVIPSTTATYSLYLSTAVSGGNSIAFSTGSKILINGSAGVTGQAIRSYGDNSPANWGYVVTSPMTGDIDMAGYAFGSSVNTIIFNRDLGNAGFSTSSPTRKLQVAQFPVGVGSIYADGTSTVVGTGTEFTNTFKIGDSICVNESGPECFVITGIADDTTLTIDGAFAPYGFVGYTLTGGDRFVVSGNGNIGIQVLSPKTDLQVGGYGGLESSDNTDDISFTGNYYFDGANWRYINSDAASMITLSGGAITFYGDIAGVADDVVAPTPFFQITAPPPDSFAACFTGGPPLQMGHCTDMNVLTGACTCVVP